MAIGDTFNSSGRLYFILSHKTTLHWPLLSFSETSYASIFVATGCSADTCVPRSISSSIWIKFQGFPVIVGYPFVVKFINFPAAGWYSAKHYGHIDPL